MTKETIQTFFGYPEGKQENKNDSSKILFITKSNIKTSDISSLIFEEEKSTLAQEESTTNKTSCINNTKNIEIERISFNETTKRYKIQIKANINKFVAQEKWIGEIIDINADIITAHIQDLTGTKTEMEEIQFGHDAIDVDDRKLASVGSIFYWYIGYNKKPTGEMRRYSYIRLQRRPKLSIDFYSKKLADAKKYSLPVSDAQQSEINDFLKQS